MEPEDFKSQGLTLGEEKVFKQMLVEMSQASHETDKVTEQVSNKSTSEVATGEVGPVLEAAHSP